MILILVCSLCIPPFNWLMADGVSIRAISH